MWMSSPSSISLSFINLEVYYRYVKLIMHHFLFNNSHSVLCHSAILKISNITDKFPTIWPVGGADPRPCTQMWPVHPQGPGCWTSFWAGWRGAWRLSKISVTCYLLFIQRTYNRDWFITTTIATSPLNDINITMSDTIHTLNFDSSTARDGSCCVMGFDSVEGSIWWVHRGQNHSVGFVLHLKLNLFTFFKFLVTFCPKIQKKIIIHIKLTTF